VVCYAIASMLPSLLPLLAASYTQHRTGTRAIGDSAGELRDEPPGGTSRRGQCRYLGDLFWQKFEKHCKD
jgi:hypothetical protein